MPKKAKSILKSFLIETVARKRKCAHSGKEMVAGERCLVFSDGFKKTSGYSVEAVKKMVLQARTDLEELERQLGIL